MQTDNITEENIHSAGAEAMAHGDTDTVNADTENADTVNAAAKGNGRTAERPEVQTGTAVHTKADAAAAKKASDRRAHNIVMAGMLSAVAFILMFFDFPIPLLMPAFIKMDISDLPALLGSFALGPVYGIIISFVKNLLIIVIKGSTTACTGELCNFLMGAVFAFTAGMIYKLNKNRHGALAGAFIGAAAMAVLSLPINYFISYPAYVKFYGLPLETIIAMYQAIIPSVDGLLQCLVIFNMPFTLVKGLIDVALCFMIYKPLSPILHGRK